MKHFCFQQPDVVGFLHLNDLIQLNNDEIYFHVLVWVLNKTNLEKNIHKNK